MPPSLISNGAITDSERERQKQPGKQGSSPNDLRYYFIKGPGLQFQK